LAKLAIAVENTRTCMTKPWCGEGESRKRKAEKAPAFHLIDVADKPKGGN